jgi:hypothetical protein
MKIHLNLLEYCLYLEGTSRIKCAIDTTCGNPAFVYIQDQGVKTIRGIGICKPHLRAIIDEAECIINVTSRKW